MSAVVMPYINEAPSSPMLMSLATDAVVASNIPGNVFRGRNNNKPNVVFVVANNPECISEALYANFAARAQELRAVGRDADAAELERTLDPIQPLQPFLCAPVPPPSADNPVTSTSECRHFRLAAARLLWAFITRQPTVSLLPAMHHQLLLPAAAQLLSYANRKQPTTHARLDAGAAFSTCAKWVFADDRAALLAVLRVGCGVPVTDFELPALARHVYQILLLDNQAARRHGYSALASERALGSTLDTFPVLQDLLFVANLPPAAFMPPLVPALPSAPCSSHPAIPAPPSLAPLPSIKAQPSLTLLVPSNTHQRKRPRDESLYDCDLGLGSRSGWPLA